MQKKSEIRLPSVVRTAAELYALLKKVRGNERRALSEHLASKKRLSHAEKRAAGLLAFMAGRYRIRIERLLGSPQCIGLPGLESRHKKHRSASDRFQGDPSDVLAVAAVLALFDSGSTFERDPVPGEELEEAVSALTHLEPDEYVRCIEGMRSAYTELESRTGELITQGRADEDTIAHMAFASALPAWIVKAWLRDASAPLALQQAYQLGLSLLKPAPVYVRIDSRKTTSVRLSEELQAAGITVEQVHELPHALRLPPEIRVEGLASFQRAEFEVQDLSSQLAAFALSPGANWSVLDACAGAGGKTLHIADMQQDAGTITASDTSLPRLKALQRRAAASGYASITTVSSRQFLTELHRHGSYDAVLVDAPCSSLGISRRRPSVKWQLSEKLVRKLAAEQLTILRRYAKFVKPGGVLVYTTCSLLPQENQDVVHAFLEDSDFALDPLAPVFASHDISIPTLPDSDGMVTIAPYMFDSDGFFISRMVRRDTL